MFKDEAFCLDMLISERSASGHQRVISSTNVPPILTTTPLNELPQLKTHAFTSKGWYMDDKCDVLDEPRQPYQGVYAQKSVKGSGSNLYIKIEWLRKKGTPVKEIFGEKSGLAAAEIATPDGPIDLLRPKYLIVGYALRQMTNSTEDKLSTLNPNLKTNKEKLASKDNKVSGTRVTPDSSSWSVDQPSVVVVSPPQQERMAVSEDSLTDKKRRPD